MNMGALVVATVVCGAAPDGVAIDLAATVFAGDEEPALLVTAYRAVRRLQIAVAADGLAQQVFVRRNLAKGGHWRVPLAAKVGTTHFGGAADIVFADGERGTVPLRFAVQVQAGLLIRLPYDRLQLQAGTLQVQLSRAAARCEYEIHVWDFDVPITGTAIYAGEAAGTWLDVHWQPYGPSDDVMRISLTCYDLAGVAKAQSFYPWHYEVHHEQIMFATGQYAIRGSEAAKLDVALRDIAWVVRRYGETVPLRLYITGYADTEGAKDVNTVLSLHRAEEMGRYFSRRGLRIPIYVAGLGESALAVPTADEVSELRNRRARFVLASEDPRGTAWQALAR